MMDQLKSVIGHNFVSVASGATATHTPIDTIGYDWATIDIMATTQAASTQAGGPAVLKLQESDQTQASTFADVSGFRGGSAAATNVDFVLGIGSTSLPNAYKMNVDLRARKRYLSVLFSPQTTQSVVSVVNLGRPENAPASAIKAGVLNLVEG